MELLNCVCGEMPLQNLQGFIRMSFSEPGECPNNFTGLSIGQDQLPS